MGPRTKRAATTSSTCSTLRLDELSSEKQSLYNEMVQDFDKQLEKHMQDLDIGIESFKKQLESMANLEILNKPRAIRKTPFADVLSFNFNGHNGNNGNNSHGETKRSELEEVAETIESQVRSQIKSTAKKGRGRPKNPASAARNNALKTPSQASSAMPPPTAGNSTVRRSTRKRTTRNAFVEETPVNSGRAGRFANPMATPMITPKFDISTPLNRSVMRLAKPDETLVSLSGSPVYAGVSAVKASGRGRGKKGAGQQQQQQQEMVPIPLSKGRTLMMPIGGVSAEGSSSGLELDEEERIKLLAIRSNLDSMLNMAEN